MCSHTLRIDRKHIGPARLELMKDSPFIDEFTAYVDVRTRFMVEGFDEDSPALAAAALEGLRFTEGYIGECGAVDVAPIRADSLLLDARRGDIHPATRVEARIIRDARRGRVSSEAKSS